MAQDITISVSDSDYDALEYTAANVQEWVQNAANSRALAAGNEIISLLVAHCNANNIAIATGRAAQIAQAYELNVVDTAANRNAVASAEE